MDTRVSPFPCVGSPVRHGRVAKKLEGEEGAVHVLLKKEGYVLFCLKHGKRSTSISFPLICPCEAAYVADLNTLPDAGERQGGPWALPRHPCSPSTETFLLLMWGVSDSTLYSSFSSVFHQKVSIQRLSTRTRVFPLHECLQSWHTNHSSELQTSY